MHSDEEDYYEFCTFLYQVAAGADCLVAIVKQDDPLVVTVAFAQNLPL